MRRVCFAVSVMGLVTLASQRARAQEPDTTSAAQRAGFALARLGGGQLVRIHNRRVGRRQGVVVSSSADRLTLETSFWGRIEVPASDVDSLWVRGGGHAGTGALIGAVLGGVDRKSTRLNSSHLVISYAVFCLKKKTKAGLGWWVRCTVVVKVAS